MANEAVCIETPTYFTQYTVADGAGIAKGTLLALSSDPNIATAGAANDVFAGIAWEEKVANDGVTQIGAALNGTWDIKSQTLLTLGSIVSLSGANLVKAATAGELLTGAAFGKVLETASINEVVRIRLGLV